MRRIKYYVSLDFYGAEHEEIVEFDDYTTDAEINKNFELWQSNYLDSGWEEIEGDEE